MYVVTVEFVVWPKHVEEFHQAIQQQAHNSLALEPGCHQFDVSVDPQTRERICSTKSTLTRRLSRPIWPPNTS